MTKNDLKTGMIVETRDNEYALIMGNAVLTLEDNNGGGAPLSLYNEEMLYRGEKEWDIVCIYAERTDLSGSSLEWKLKNSDFLIGELIWERESEIKEMTPEQVCKELGKEIKIVKG